MEKVISQILKCLFSYQQPDIHWAEKGVVVVLKLLLLLFYRSAALATCSCSTRPRFDAPGKAGTLVKGI